MRGRRVGISGSFWWMAGNTPCRAAVRSWRIFWPRDLTINAMARDGDGTIHAHPMALRDLNDRILRPCSPTALADDPLRVFRAARFLAVFPDFSPAPDLLPQMRSVADSGLLDNIPAERVGRETLKAMAAPLPGRFLDALDQSGCLDPWFRELSRASSIPAGPPPHHHSSLLGHTAKVMNRLADKGAEPLAVWAGLCHDLGKALTPEDVLPRHIGHEAAGEGPARELARRLKLSNKYMDAGILAAKFHMKAGRYPELRPGTRVDLLASLQARGLVRVLFLLAEADGHGDFLKNAQADLEAMLSVSLPEKDRNQGEASGQKLRMLRAERLARGS